MRRETPLGTEEEAGRNDGIEATMARDGGRLLGFIRSRVGDEEDARDLLQDVFLSLLSSPSVTEPIEDLTAWLFTVARNRIVDWYRRRRPALALREGLEGAEGGKGPEWDHWRSSVWSELEDALEELPEEEREVFVAHEFLGETFKEMAERSGEPLGTLLSRKHRAVLFLRERLRDLYGEIGAL